MERNAALTADIVDSRNIDPGVLEQRLKELAKLIEQRFFKRKRTFEFFRGDSFQAILPAQEALRAALCWMAGIASTNAGGQEWNLRIAIGVGDITHIGQTTATSGGSALEFSGLLLDELKKKDYPRIGIRTFSEQWNEQLQAECLLADAVMQRWKSAAAEAVFYQLLYDETQEQLAKRLNIAQSSVNKRLNSANWPAILNWERYFRTQAVSYLKTNQQ